MSKVLLSLLSALCVFGSENLIAGELEVNAVARMEAEKHPGSRGLGLGASSLYTFVDWELYDGWNFSMSNHLLSSSPADLYKGLFKSQSLDFLDWAYVDYTTGPFSFQIGKDILAMGLFELDPCDVDSHGQLNGQIWNEMSLYQWGAKASYMINENNTLTFGVANSPYEYGKYFEHGLFSFGLKWSGEVENFKTLWSLNRFGKKDLLTGERSSDWYLLLGNSYTMGDIVFTGDVYIKNFHSFIPSVSARTSITDFLDIDVKTGFYGGEGFYVGAVAEARPIKTLENLTFFLCSTFQGYYEKGYSGSLGIKYSFAR